METTMNRNRIAILNEQFRTDTGQGINAALTLGVHPRNEYLAALGELACVETSMAFGGPLHLQCGSAGQ